MHRRLERLDAGHAVAQEGASVLDVRDVVGVAQAALGAVLLGGVVAARRDRLGLFAPVLRDRGAGDGRAHSSAPAAGAPRRTELRELTVEVCDAERGHRSHRDR